MDNAGVRKRQGGDKSSFVYLLIRGRSPSAEVEERAMTGT